MISEFQDSQKELHRETLSGRKNKNKKTKNHQNQNQNLEISSHVNTVQNILSLEILEVAGQGWVRVNEWSLPLSGRAC
jgi:hypothetical protein